MTAGAIIEHLGGFSTRVLLGSETLNSPRNAMLLAPLVHKRFDRLDLWLTPFEASGYVLNLCTWVYRRLQDHREVIPDKYKINYVRGIWHFRASATFQTYTLSNNKKIEPPSPKLIALHAACAKIAHMSGAAEHLEETFRDTEPLPVMTVPNATDELFHALKKVQFQHITRPVYV